MKIKDCMTRDVKMVTPDSTLSEAAKMMAELDAGVVPVNNGDQLVGMITDRDIAIRGIAAGKGPNAKVSECMSKEAKYCFMDDDVGGGAAQHGRHQASSSSRAQQRQAARRHCLDRRSRNQRRVRHGRRCTERNFRSPAASIRNGCTRPNRSSAEKVI